MVLLDYLDQLVEVTHTTVVFCSLVDAMTFGALKFSIGAFNLLMVPQILSGNLYLLTCVTDHFLEGANLKMTFKLDCLERSSIATVWAGN